MILETPNFFIRVVENSFHLHNRTPTTYLDTALVLHWTRIRVTNVGDDRFDESRYERLIVRNLFEWKKARGMARSATLSLPNAAFILPLGKKVQLRWAQLPWADAVWFILSSWTVSTRSPPPDPCGSSIVKLTVSLRNRSSERFSSNYRNACARTISSLFQEEDRYVIVWTADPIEFIDLEWILSRFDQPRFPFFSSRHCFPFTRVWV